MHHSSSFNAQQFQTYKISVQSNTTPMHEILQTKGKLVGYLEQPLNSQKKKLHTNQKSLLTINRNISNVQTRAMSSHNKRSNEDCNQNFSSSYYLNSYRHKIDTQQISLLQSIIDKYRKDNQQAQDVAKELDQECYRNKLKCSQNFEQNFQSIQLRVSQHSEKQKSMQKKMKLQHKNLVKKLYSNLKEVVQHILNKEGETKFERLNQKLQDKEAANIVELRGKKLDTNDNILENVQLIRVLLSKKTDEYEILREIESSLKLEQDNPADIYSEFKDTEFGDTTTTITNMERQSKISRFSEELQKRKEKDDQKKIKKYFNIEKLKDKWHTQSEDQIKETMHRTLVRDTLAYQERQLIKRGGQKKITKEETLAKATQKQGISQYAITKDQLLHSQEQSRKELLVQSQILIPQKQVNNSLSASKIFVKLHEIEKKVDNKKTERRALSMDVKKREQITMIEQGEKAKKDLISHSQQQGQLQFMRKTLSYSSAFLQKAKQIK